MKIKVAGIQMTCADDRDSNLKKAVKLGRMAAESGARIICYQPMFNTTWFPRAVDDTNFSLAENKDGPTLTLMAGAAVELGACLIMPIFEKDGGKYYYTAFVINHEGSLIGKYRKVHIPDIPLWREKHYFSPGDMAFPVIEHEGIRFGIQICWDNFFPEGARILALEGAEIIFAPTAAAFYSHNRWETVMAAAAIVNNVYMMRVNRVGSEEEQDFYGRSFCIDPEGEFLIGPIGIHDGVVLAEVDMDKIENIRSEWNFFGDRRAETYGPLTQSG